MPPPPQLRLLRPLILLATTVWFLPITIFEIVTQRDWQKLSSLSSFRDAWFGRFWQYFGPGSVRDMSPVVVPLIAKARGVVLDVGPASGHWLTLYSRKNNPHMTKTYGIEPNKEHHAALRQAVIDAGLDGIYEILPVKAQELSGLGFQEQSFDTIITLHVLCSIPDAGEAIRILYPYLRKNGRWVVCEHICSSYQDSFISFYQYAINMIWPICLNGCSLTKHTGDEIQAAGPWSKIDVGPANDEGPWDPVPHITGVYYK